MSLVKHFGLEERVILEQSRFWNAFDDSSSDPAWPDVPEYSDELLLNYIRLNPLAVMVILSAHLAIDWDQLDSRVKQFRRMVEDKALGKRPASLELGGQPRARPTTPELIKGGETFYSDAMSTSTRSAVLGWAPHSLSDGPQLKDEIPQEESEASFRSSPPLSNNQRPPPSAQPTEPLTESP